MVDILIKGGRVIDPGFGFDDTADLLVLDGKVVEQGAKLSAPDGATVIDASGLLVTPGLVDIHVHLREPGQEYKEDIESASRSALAGGFTAVCSMPNTSPVNDCRAVTDLIMKRAREVNGVRVFPIGAVSKGLKGEQLAEIGEMKDAGIVAISDDGMPVMNAQLQRRALEYGSTFDLPMIQHAEDLHLSAGGCMHEGPVSTRLGLPGQSAASETVMVARDIQLVEQTGARYHIAHITTATGVDLVRQAKKRGLPVTCEVTPHHLHLTDEACMTYNTSMKVNPPLRPLADLRALRDGIADGTIDAIATDHAPHTSLEKDISFEEAAFGMIGLETSVPLTLALVRDGFISLSRMIEMLTVGGARILGIPGGTLKKGGPADVTLIDPEHSWKVQSAEMQSKSRNCPFEGWEVQGKAVLTMIEGRVLHDERRLAN